ncbi:MAG: S41 family peptidase [Rhodospirillales bacterium]|nr:S41 family peptidase [Rhodospirillales bacterium]MDP6644551.1 S41 family peptidase [Rhodospirillales bacterium]MDP6843821.1 S41 family peptidase [Rhodospirillales bacterium]
MTPIIFKWPIILKSPLLLGASALIAAGLATGLASGPAAAGLQERVRKPALAPVPRRRPDDAYRHLAEFGRVFENLAGGSAADTIKALDLFAEVFNRVRTDYWKPVRPRLLIEAAIAAARARATATTTGTTTGGGAAAQSLAIAAVRGMIGALDPYSGFTAAADRAGASRRHFGNIGLEVFVKKGAVTVISPHDGSPAARAGLSPGDVITGVDGNRFSNPTLGQALEKLQGPVGSEVRLLVTRPGAAPFEARMLRAIAPGRTVRARLDGRVAVIRIASFSANTTRDLRRALKKLRAAANAKAARLDGVVLDLRNNSGGLLNAAINVADTFLDSGEIVSTRARAGPEGNSRQRRFNARLGDAVRGKPVAVVVNAGSASAAEIVAGALQDLGRGVIIGTRSFGKGSVQTIMRIRGHGSLRLTTSHYYTPSGRSLDEAPIEPDVNAKACARLAGRSVRPGDDAFLVCAARRVRAMARAGRR